MSSHESLSPNISRLPITLRHIEEKLVSLHKLKQENGSHPFSCLNCHQSIQKKTVSFFVFLRKSHFLETLQGIEQEWIAPFCKFRQQENHSLETLLSIEEACYTFTNFLGESHLLETLIQIEHWSSFCRLPSRCIAIRDQIKEKLFSYESLKRSYPRLKDEFKLLQLEFKTLDIILDLQRFIKHPFVSRRVYTLVQDTVPDIGKFYYNLLQQGYLISRIKNIVRRTKLEISDMLGISADRSLSKILLQLSPNKDSIVNPDIAVEFIDNVVKNFGDVLNFINSSGVVFIREPDDRIEKVIEELKFLRSFVCFVSDRYIETQIQHTLFTHVLVVTWYTAISVWLYLPSNDDGHQDATSGQRSICLLQV